MQLVNFEVHDAPYCLVKGNISAQLIVYLLYIGRITQAHVSSVLGILGKFYQTNTYSLFLFLPIPFISRCSILLIPDRFSNITVWNGYLQK